MPPPAQGQGEADNSLAALWIIIGIFVLGAFIWYFFSSYIVAFVFTIRWYEAQIIRLFIPNEWAVELNQAQQVIQASKATGYGNITIPQLVAVSDAIGKYLRYPFAIILLALSIVIFTGNPLSKYKKKYSMKQLLDSQKEIWPQIEPVAKLDLVQEDLNKGPWAMAMSPMDFAKKHNLLIVEKVVPSDSLLRSRAILTATINRDEARKIFALQVGSYWQKVERLPIHIRALFAVFAARMVGDRDAPTKLLAQIAASAKGGKLDFTGTDELLRKNKDNKQVQNIISNHAYILTVMASMLKGAREDGVVASADFLWLKPLDRKLWFMLNCVGRQTPFSEIAGPFAHWLAEMEMGRRLNVPMIEEAVNGLAEAMKEFIYKPDEED